MTYRLIGAVLIIAGCGGFGFSMVLEQKKQAGLLHRMISALQFMQWDLQYRLTPLPELLLKAGRQGGGTVEKILTAVSQELIRQVYPDVASCMGKVLQEQQDQPRPVRLLFRQLGGSLGNFDLTGQMEGLKHIQQACENQLAELESGKAQRYRSYETLGLCAGAAMVILFV